MDKIGVGADGAKWTKKGPLQEFKTNIGIVVAVKDRQTFPERYSKAIESACKKNGITWTRPFTKGTDLRYVAGSDIGAKVVIGDILQAIKSEIDHVLVVYTLLFPSRVPKVYIYTDEPPVIPMTSVDFQDKLEHPYPHLCLWAYLQNQKSSEKPYMASDHFAGEVTSAWQDLETQSPPHIFFDGGNTNAMVSLADILIRLLDERIGQESLNKILHPSEIPRFLPELSGRVSTSYLGQQFLKQITPRKREKINTVPHIAHPIFFVVKEPTSVLTSDFISRTPTMDHIYHATVKAGGCTKFYDSKDPNDQRLIKPGDYFLWTGEHGKRFVESLPSLGYKDLNCGDASTIGAIVKS